ncbi:MAG: hypothetical protein ACOC9W_02725 [Persicimonas sp.]
MSQQNPTRSAWSRTDIALVVPLVVLGVVARLWWGLGDDGIFHPDEIYQVIEPAHELIYGFGLHGWEWDVGGRNWTLPALMAALMGGLELMGLDHPDAYMPAVRGSVAALHAASGVGVYMIARQYGARRLFCVLGAALFLFNPASIYLGYRPLSEVISTPLVVLGLAGALGADRGRKAGRIWFVMALSLLGLSVLMRLQNALFAVVALGAWRLGGKSERYQSALKVLTVWALLYGLIDWVTWGLPYQSAGSYLRFNLIMDATTEYYGADSPLFYPAVFITSMKTGAILLMALPLLAWRRARTLVLCAVGFVVLHSLIPHKDLRFVIAALPLLAALAAVGLEVVSDGVATWSEGKLANTKRAAQLTAAAASLLVVGALAHGLWSISELTFDDLGQAQTLGVDPATSAFDHRGELNRLLADLAERPDVCGLYMPTQWVVGAGGHTYFHRDVPFFHQGNPPSEPTQFNYVVSDKPLAAPERDWQPVQTGGDSTAYVSGRTECTPAPDYQPRIYQEVDE